MNVQQKSGYAKIESNILSWLLSHPFTALAMHWTFQSLFYMDTTERRFKLLLDSVLTLSAGMMLSIWLPWPVAWLISFLLAHTANFLFNGQLWGVLKHYGMVKLTYEEFRDYAQLFAERAQREPAIRYVITCGSLSRQEWKTSSDLDARIVRYPGIINGLRACTFLLRERTRAFFASFPLDVYVLDNEISLTRLNPNEKLLELGEVSRDCTS